MKAAEFEKNDLFRVLNKPAHPPEMVFRVQDVSGEWINCRRPMHNDLDQEYRYSFSDDGYLKDALVEKMGKGVAPKREHHRGKAKKHTMAKPIDWQVIRKGRTKGSDRVVFRGSEKVARETYDKLAENLRQGSVRLQDATGNIIARTEGGMNRTKW